MNTFLCTELNQMIFNHLDVESLSCSRLICKKWHVLVNDNRLWKKFVPEKMPLQQINLMAYVLRRLVFTQKDLYTQIRRFKNEPGNHTLNLYVLRRSPEFFKSLSFRSWEKIHSASVDCKCGGNEDVKLLVLTICIKVKDSFIKNLIDKEDRLELKKASKAWIVLIAVGLLFVALSCLQRHNLRSAECYLKC